MTTTTMLDMSAQFDSMIADAAQTAEKIIADQSAACRVAPEGKTRKEKVSALIAGADDIALALIATLGGSAGKVAREVLNGEQVYKAAQAARHGTYLPTMQVLSAMLGGEPVAFKGRAAFTAMPETLRAQADELPVGKFDSGPGYKTDRFGVVHLTAKRKALEAAADMAERIIEIANAL